MLRAVVCASILGAGLLQAQTDRSSELAKDDVLKLLRGGVTNARVVALVEQHGAAFDLTPPVREELQGAGAGPELLAAIEASGPRTREARAHIAAGDRAHATGMMAKAAREYTQAWEKWPRDGSIGLKAARIWKNLGDYGEAARILAGLVHRGSEAVRAEGSKLLQEIQPHLRAAYSRRMNEGRNYLATGLTAKARDAFAEAALMQSQEAEPHLHGARAAAVQDDTAAVQSEILAAARLGAVNARDVFAFGEFDSLLTSASFQEFVRDVFGPTGLQLAQDLARDRELQGAVAAERRAEAEKRAARRAELQARIPQLLAQAAAAEREAVEAGEKSQKAAYSARTSNSSTWGGLIGGAISSGRANSERKKQQQLTEKAARLRAEASALQTELNGMPTAAAQEPAALAASPAPDVAAAPVAQALTQRIDLQVFAISYPQDWQSYRAERGIELAPPPHIVNTIPMRGAVVRSVAPGGVVGGTNLDSDFKLLVLYLRRTGWGDPETEPVPVQVDGRPGRAIEFLMVRTLRGRGAVRLRVWVVAAPHPGAMGLLTGGYFLCFAAFIAPEDEFGSYRPLFESMARTLAIRALPLR